MLLTDAVPTSVVRGPDGAFYISQLTDSRSSRVTPTSGASFPARRRRSTPPASRTSPISPSDRTDRCTPSRSPARPSQRPIGSLKRINPGTSLHETLIGGLFAPYGVALRQGNAYLEHLRRVCRRRAGHQDPSRLDRSRGEPRRGVRAPPRRRARCKSGPSGLASRAAMHAHAATSSSSTLRPADPVSAERPLPEPRVQALGAGLGRPDYAARQAALRQDLGTGSRRRLPD